MFKNIGRSVRVLALVLAGLCFVGFAVLGALCLVAALGDGVDETLKKAGLQAAIISFVLAVLTPFLQLVTYGLGVLIDSARENAQNSKRVRELLQSALADGQLSTEIARKNAITFGKLLPLLQKQAPEQAQTNAPVQRPVAQPTTLPCVEPTPDEEEENIEEEISVEPIESAAAEIAQTPEERPKAQAKPAPVKPSPAKPAPVKPAPVKPLAGTTAFRPLTDDIETF